MKYNSESQINTIDQVKEFFDYLTTVRRVNFNPDDDFADYIDLSTHEPTFDAEEVAILNNLMDQSFEVCEANQTDIYELAEQRLFAKND